jgi:hypothetical protein
MRHAVFTAGLVAIWLGGCAAARAASPPAQLLGKSVTVTWSEDQTRVSADRGTFNRTFQQKVGIYVSTKGQVFTRRTATGGRGKSGTQELLADGAARMSADFQSGAMVVTSANQRGLARRIVVQFDQQSAGCTAQVIVGIAGGGTARMKGLVGGQDVEVKSMTASAVTCAISVGNVLAGPGD